MKTIEVNDFSDVPKNFTGVVKLPSGTKEWFLNGKKHREEGPCTTCKDCLEGNFVLCTKPGPAVEHSDGTKFWHLNDKLHREDGPAVEFPNGTKEWWVNGKHHREDGPAIDYPNGIKYWYLNGKEVDKQAIELFYMLKYKKEIKP